MPSNLAVTSSVFPMLPPVRSQRPRCSAKCLHHVATQGACSSWEFRALAVPFKLIWSEWIWLADANDLGGILCHLSLSPCTCVPTCHLFILHCHTCKTHLQIKIPQASTSIHKPQTYFILSVNIPICTNTEFQFTPNDQWTKWCPNMLWLSVPQQMCDGMQAAKTCCLTSTSPIARLCTSHPPLNQEMNLEPKHGPFEQYIPRSFRNEKLSGSTMVPYEIWNLLFDFWKRALGGWTHMAQYRESSPQGHSAVLSALRRTSQHGGSRSACQRWNQDYTLCCSSLWVWSMMPHWCTKRNGHLM